jgi:glutamate-5-semialdehyde dehydrogenase
VRNRSHNIVNALSPPIAAAADTWLAAAATVARAATRVLALSGRDQRDAGLRHAAEALRARSDSILAANARDVAAYQGSAALLDRLTLTPERVAAMARGLDEIADLPDPLGRTLAAWQRPNGLRFTRVAAPIGVIGMIYESRPNVGADAAGICLKSGNAVILRGGSDSRQSAAAIHAAMRDGLELAGLPKACVQIAPDTDRAYVAAMLGATGLLDLIIPRGGKSLVERVQREARVPVLAHAEGLCHTYVHEGADPVMARRVLANAKMRRTGVCGATETLLIDATIAPSLLPLLVGDLRALGCDFRGDARARDILPELRSAADFHTEWLDAVLSIGVVDGVDAAIDHIAHHGSQHTDAIVTEDAVAAERFLARVDSAVVLWNASTQFCDGGEFGFGAEIGIATGRLHARGPVGVEQLTTYRYVVRGEGQIRK